jgi:glucose-6-phosphate dehydrogenase assembly protein OpcA
MGQVRITDSVRSDGGAERLAELAANYTPGDTDLSWARLTLWRGLIAAALDQPPFAPVTDVRIEGQAGHTSIDLLAAWMTDKLGARVTVVAADGAKGLVTVDMRRIDPATGDRADITFSRPDGRIVTISRPGTSARTLSLATRTIAESLVEELRRLAPDLVYAVTLTRGLAAFAATGFTLADPAQVDAA